MIHVTVLYPLQEGARFDMDYYLNRHIPLVETRLQGAVKKVIVEKGLGGAAPGTPPAYTVVSHLAFDSVEAFNAAFAPHAAELLADIPNYTDLEPVFQISEVVESR